MPHSKNQRMQRKLNSKTNVLNKAPLPTTPKDLKCVQKLPKQPTLFLVENFSKLSDISERSNVPQEFQEPRDQLSIFSESSNQDSQFVFWDQNSLADVNLYSMSNAAVGQRSLKNITIQTQNTSSTCIDTTFDLDDDLFSGLF
ncbi:Hypothetical_protein [Hexamita inflata]|uniref:Hypothetical_protein n=1 Tax=Hexamita inflata TaxID=28002 RepID=A0ABP1GRV3_9EUKA